MANDALFFGAEPENGCARFGVRLIGRELNTNAGHVFEGCPQHQVLGFGVDERPLPGGGKPCAADFELSILVIDLPEAGGADDLTGLANHGDEWLDSAGCVAIQGNLNVGIDGFYRRHDRERQIPEGSVGGRSHERGGVSGLQLAQLNSRAGEC